MRKFLFVCTALVLATSAYGQPNEGHKAAKKHARVAEASQAGLSSQELSSDQIRASIVGNTVVGVEDGEAYAEFLRPNGSLSGRARSGAYYGEWRISGNRICFLYKEDKKGWDCSHVKLRGSQIVWAEKGGGGSVATLLRGNPRGL
jgi:hypothetical protein